MLTLDTINRALLLENIHPDATARLTKAGYQVRAMPRALGEDELIDALQGDQPARHQIADPGHGARPRRRP